MPDRDAWPVGRLTLIDGEPFTVVPTASAVPRDEINVMRHGAGSVRTVRLDRLAEPDSELSAIEVIWGPADFALKCTECGKLLDGHWSTLADIVETARACTTGHEVIDRA